MRSSGRGRRGGWAVVPMEEAPGALEQTTPPRQVAHGGQPHPRQHSQRFLTSAAVGTDARCSTSWRARLALRMNVSGRRRPERGTVRRWLKCRRPVPPCRNAAPSRDSECGKPSGRRAARRRRQFDLVPCHCLCHPDVPKPEQRLSRTCTPAGAAGRFCGSHRSSLLPHAGCRGRLHAVKCLHGAGLLDRTTIAVH